MASNFYRSQDSPKYLLGHGLELGFVVVGLLAVILLRLNYQRINKKRDSLPTQQYSDVEMSKMSDMGDRAPTFRYVL